MQIDASNICFHCFQTSLISMHYANPRKMAELQQSLGMVTSFGPIYDTGGVFGHL